MATKRDPFWDLLKTWAIFLVILQHMIACLGEGLNMWNTPMGKAITMFNMPLFVFIVGYFSLSSYNRAFKEVVSQKWQTLIRPMLIFCTIMLTINIIPPIALDDIMPGKPAYVNFILFGCKQIYGAIFNSYWFIWSIIIYIFWTYLFINTFFPRYFIIAIIVAFFSFYFLPSSPIHNFSTDKALYPFFIMGILFRKYHLMSHIYRYSNILLVISLSVFGLLYYCYSSNLFFYHFATLPLKEVLIGYCFLIPAGISGILLSIFIMKAVSRKRNRLCVYLEFIGQYTFFIYMSQQVVVNILSKMSLSIHNLAIQIISSVILLVGLSFLIHLLKENKTLSLYILGKQ